MAGPIAFDLLTSFALHCVLGRRIAIHDHFYKCAYDLGAEVNPRSSIREQELPGFKVIWSSYIRAQKYIHFPFCNYMYENFEMAGEWTLTEERGGSKPEYPEKPPDNQSKSAPHIGY